VATYDYTDPGGEFLFQVVRVEPGKHGKKKEFYQRRRGRQNPKQWVNDLKGVHLVLYNLPEVVKSDYAFVVEGEKDVERARKLGIVATTTPMGATKGGVKVQNQQEAFDILDPLKGKRVYLIPDNHDVGVEHMEQIAAILYEKKMKELKLIPLLKLPPKGDLSDWADMVGDKNVPDLLRARVKELPAWIPPKRFVTLGELMDMDLRHSPPVLAGGLWPEGANVLIAGETGVGKSLLRQHLALHLVKGADWLENEVRRPRRVAVLQYENTPIMEQTRNRKMLSGLGWLNDFPFDNLVYIDKVHRVDLARKSDAEKLKWLVKETGCEIILYDCLRNLHTASENKNSDMGEIFGVIENINDQLGTSSLIIHHFGKPTEGTLDRWRIRGAQAIQDAAVTAWIYTVKHHEHKTLMKLTCTKIRDGPQPKPILLERDENFLVHPVSEDTLCPPLKVVEILENLGGSVEMQKDLIKAIIVEIGCHAKSARRFINNAVNDMQIEPVAGSHNKKGYRLP